jgi:hypothetical protein
LATLATWQTVPAAQASEKGAVFVGGWTLNKELSDSPAAPPSSDRDRPGDAGRQGGGGGRGGRGGRRGGFGGGGQGDGGFGANAPARADAVARMRDALRDITNPPDHLVIVATDTMMVLTAPDGRTTRLSPDGKKIKEENTSIDRKTKWDAGKLVSEIGGLNVGKVTETFSVDAERHQLHIVAEMEGGRGGQVRTISHVYDLDAR